MTRYGILMSVMLAACERSIPEDTGFGTESNIEADTNADTDADTECLEPTGYINEAVDACYVPDQLAWFEAWSTDPVYAPSELQVAFTSNIDGPLSTAEVSTGEHTEFVVYLSQGDHILTRETVNPCGASDTKSISFTVGCALSPPLIQVTPDMPTADDALSVVIDDAAVCPGLTHTIEWSVNGLVVQENGATLPASLTAPQDTVAVQVTPSRECQEGYPVTALVSLESP